MSGFTDPDLIQLLCCPHCRRPLTAVPSSSGQSPRTLGCEQGHRFDLARQGYLNLLTGRGAPGQGDSAAMLDNRVAVFAAGHFAPLAEALVEVAAGASRFDGRHDGAVRQSADGRSAVLDCGAGPGYYLASVLGNGDPRQTRQTRQSRHSGPNSGLNRYGLALDVSVPAARRAARAHERLGSVVADVRGDLPVRDHCIDVLLDVFAPRNAAEFHRVLRPSGKLIVVTPQPDHLAGLVGPLGLLTVDPAKEDRLRESLSEHFSFGTEDVVRWTLDLTAAEAAEVISMGPNAHHIGSDELRQRLAERPRWQVRASVGIKTLHPRT